MDNIKLIDQLKGIHTSLLVLEQMLGLGNRSSDVYVVAVYNIRKRICNLILEIEK